jgi:putative sugar O-methyltransferase
MPYDLDIRDIQIMAYRHAELMSKISSTPHPSNYSISSFGNPSDIFKIGNNHFNILSLTFYIRLCYVNQFVALKGDEIIVELGSGSCHQIEIIKKLYPNITILYFDLPGPLYLGEKFLSEALGKNSIVSSNECSKWSDLSKISKGKVHFFGNWQCELVKNITYDIFWNSASFGEMEPHVVKHYLSVFSENAKYVYLLQASNGKESGRVKDQINFNSYSEWLPNFNLIAIDPAYKIHKPMTASGGYLQAVWKKNSL